MWRTETPWFLIALVMAVFAVGGVFFGRFEQHRPPTRRVVKQGLVLAVFVLVDTLAGRPWALGLLALAGVGVLLIHGWWLPKHGVNGWTAEPYDRYLALVAPNQRPGAGEAPKHP